MAEGGDDFIEYPTYEPDDIDSVVVPPAQEQSLGVGVDSLRQELLEGAVNSYYNSLEETPELGRDYSKFMLDDKARLRLKAFPGMNLINARDKKPLAFSTVAGREGGSEAIRELGFTNWASHKKEPPKSGWISALQQMEKRVEAVAKKVEAIELQGGKEADGNIDDAVRQLETSLTDADVDEILATVTDPPLNLREVKGLDRAFQRVQGELVNNLAKLSELDAHIALERRKLGEALDEIDRRRIKDRLRSLEEERAARLEAASANREALRSQISRIRETIRRVLHEDTTLAERLRTLFQEQGITIVSILTAIGMVISTLVLALTPGGAPSPPPAPSDKGGLKEWVKKHLESLGRALAKLAGKAAAALPGIIGSIVSWLLSTLGKAASWFAENLWATVLAVGGLLLVAAHDKLRSS